MRQNRVLSYQQKYHLQNVFVKENNQLNTIQQLPGPITGNDRSFGCPIIFTDTNSQLYFVHQHLNHAWYNKGHWLTGRPYLAMIVSNVLRKRHKCSFCHIFWYHYHRKIKRNTCRDSATATRIGDASDMAFVVSITAIPEQID